MNNKEYLLYKSYSNDLKEAYDVFKSTPHEEITLSVNEREALIKDARKESFRVLAYTVGLHGVSTDICGFVSNSNDEYRVIQPILTHTDLRHALQRDLSLSSGVKIRNLFLSVDDNDRFDSFALSSELRKLDFASFSQQYTYQCKFVRYIPEQVLTGFLYAQYSKKDKELTCSIKSPSGEIIAKKYSRTSVVAGISLEYYLVTQDTITSFVVDNTLIFTLDMFYGSKSSVIDAFTEVRNSHDGFDEHVLSVIKKWNKSQLVCNFLRTADLTKNHLSSSFGNGNYVGFEYTPLCELSKFIMPLNYVALRIFVESVKSASEKYLISLSDPEVSELPALMGKLDVNSDGECDEIIKITSLSEVSIFSTRASSNGTNPNAPSFVPKSNL
ncbi:MAG: hypothetical protein P1U74_08585 [Legionellaceae bacterium]|nr:hypothetical protein [Legionellaceae bacterium]